RPRPGDLGRAGGWQEPGDPAEHRGPARRRQPHPVRHERSDESVPLLQYGSMITQQIGASTGLAPRHTVPLPVTIATPAIIAIVGAMITVVGSALPWVTIFRGTQTLTGWNGSPRYLAGPAVASVALTLLFLSAGRPAAFRRLAVLTGSTAVVGVAFASWQVAALDSSHSVSARILTPVLGPGPFVMVAGALLSLAVVSIPTSAARVPASLWPRAMPAAALFTAGWIHLALTPEHLGEATILGLGFL